MVIKGLIDDRLATMSFNEHNYIVKKVNGYYSTLYYLGIDPHFATYIKENNTILISGKLSKQDILSKKETIYSGITINKDEEDIDINDINEKTTYLKNIDVNTGICLNKIYLDDKIERLDDYLYTYNKDNSKVLITPNIDEKEFNIYNLKETLTNTLTLLNYKELSISITSIKNNELNNCFNLIINIKGLDNIHTSFILDDNKKINFHPSIYSEHYYKNYNLKEDNTLIPYDIFSYYLAKCELISFLNLLNLKSNPPFKPKIYVNFNNNLIKY